MNFAGVSGDFNPMHTDAEYAKSTQFGARVAHGALIFSIATGLAYQLGFLDGTVIAFTSFDWKMRAPVFIGDTRFGSRLPNLTYMLSFENSAELEAKWDIFRNDPDWKKLSTDPRFAFDQIVTNISNLMLSPLACSQI